MPRKRKPDLPPGDDGRTIVHMNVEGMPWYAPEKENVPGETEEKGKAARPEAAVTRQEARYYTWGALKAALLVVGVICGGVILFILFCLHVWFPVE